MKNDALLVEVFSIFGSPFIFQSSRSPPTIPNDYPFEPVRRTVLANDRNNKTMRRLIPC